MQVSAVNKQRNYNIFHYHSDLTSCHESAEEQRPQACVHLPLTERTDFACSCLARTVTDRLQEPCLAVLCWIPAAEASAVCAFTYHTHWPVKQYGLATERQRTGHSHPPKVTQTKHRPHNSLQTSVSHQRDLAYLA